MSAPDMDKDTGEIQAWLRGAGTSTNALIQQLRLWADHFDGLLGRTSPTKTITDEALSVIGGDRQEAYGPAQESFQRIADLWTALLGIEIAPETVGLMMILMKVSRQHGGSYKRDNFVDLVGYAVLTNQIAQPD